MSKVNVVANHDNCAKAGTDCEPSQHFKSYAPFRHARQNAQIESIR